MLQSHDADGCIYPPIGELLKSAGLTVATLASSPETNYQAHSKKPPPHALLPDQIEDELPVHGANDRFAITLIVVNIQNTVLFICISETSEMRPRFSHQFFVRATLASDFKSGSDVLKLRKYFSNLFSIELSVMDNAGGASDVNILMLA